MSSKSVVLAGCLDLVYRLRLRASYFEATRKDAHAAEVMEAAGEIERLRAILGFVGEYDINGISVAEIYDDANGTGAWRKLVYGDEK